MIAMRNRLVHVFFKTDLFVLWRTVTENLPPLIVELETILSELNES